MPILTSSVHEIARQLPPSGTNLQLLDISVVPEGRDFLAMHRPDVQIKLGDVTDLTYVANHPSYDAILAIGLALTIQQLSALHRWLRPGGRIIMFDQRFLTPTDAAHALTRVGFVRVLAERLPDGILYRGEYPYDGNLSTQERVSIGAGPPSITGIISSSEIEATTGRYVLVLVRQTPNLPAWRLEPDTPVLWHLAALETEQHPTLVLAFSALPKAVAWMQHAVLNGFLPDIHKIVKFSKTTAAQWRLPLLLNPNFEQVLGLAKSVQFIVVDHQTAELADE